MKRSVVVWVVLIAIIGAGLFWLMSSKQAKAPATTFEAVSEGETDDWKMYTNTRYGYSIKYPPDWYVDTQYSENDFTQRGPVDDNEFIGGDTVWSNYPN